jgi:hypothetical protein
MGATAIALRRHAGSAFGLRLGPQSIEVLFESYQRHTLLRTYLSEARQFDDLGRHHGQFVVFGSSIASRLAPVVWQTTFGPAVRL